MFTHSITPPRCYSDKRKSPQQKPASSSVDRFHLKKRCLIPEAKRHLHSHSHSRRLRGWPTGEIKCKSHKDFYGRRHNFRAPRRVSSQHRDSTLAPFLPFHHLHSFHQNFPQLLSPFFQNNSPVLFFTAKKNIAFCIHPRMPEFIAL